MDAGSGRAWAVVLGATGLERILAYASEGPDITARGDTRFEVIAFEAHAAEAALAGYVEASGVVAPSVGYPALAAFANLGGTLRVELVGDQVTPPPTLSVRPVSLRARRSMHSWHTHIE